MESSEVAVETGGYSVLLSAEVLLSTEVMVSAEVLLSAEVLVGIPRG